MVYFPIFLTCLFQLFVFLAIYVFGGKRGFSCDCFGSGPIEKIAARPEISQKNGSRSVWEAVIGFVASE
jgi:hypothetical protein